MKYFSLLLLIGTCSWATNISTQITSNKTNTVQNTPVTICTSTTAKTRGLIYQMGSGYQIPQGVTFYSAQVCGYGSAIGLSVRVGTSMGPFTDGTTFLPSGGIIVSPITFMGNRAIPNSNISGCQTIGANFQSGSYPYVVADNAGTYQVCITGVEE